MELATTWTKIKCGHQIYHPRVIEITWRNGSYPWRLITIFMQDRFKGHDSFPGKTEQKVHEAGALCIWISLQPWWEYIPIWAASSMRNERSCGWGKLIMVKPNNVANLNQIFILSLVKNRMSKPSHFQRTWIQEEEKPNIKTRVVGYPRTACLVLATKDMFWTK